MKALSQILMISILSIAGFVACKKNSGGSAAPAPTCTVGQILPAGQYCNGGQIVPASACNPTTPVPAGMMCMNGYLVPASAIGGAGNLLTGVQFTNNEMQGTVNLNGTGNFDFNNPEVAYFYSGQVSVSGTAQVLNQSLCGAPMGGYTVSGTGNITSGSISGMTLTFSGPVTMQMLISSAVVDNPSGLNRNSTGNRLGILMANLTVNGSPCGSITSY